MAAAGFVSGLTVSAPTAFAVGGPTTKVTAEEALAKLIAGNGRFVASPELCSAQLAHQREHVAKVQTP